MTVMRISTAAKNAMVDSLTAAARNAAVDSLTALIDGGYIEIRTGTMPANVDDAATGALLAVHTCADPSFGASAAGTAVANAIADDTNTSAGTAGYARIYDSAGTAVIDLDVGVGAVFSVNIDTVTFVAAGTSTINSATISIAAV